LRPLTADKTFKPDRLAPNWLVKGVQEPNRQPRVRLRRDQLRKPDVKDAREFEIVLSSPSRDAAASCHPHSEEPLPLSGIKYCTTLAIDLFNIPQSQDRPERQPA
jgi:hypothetical protein